MLGSLAVALAIWLLTTEAAARILAWRRDRRWLRQWEERLGQGLSLGLFVWLCHDRGWAAWAPGYTAAIAPWVLFQCVLWWSLAPVIRQAGDARWSRAGLVLHHLRFDLAPILAVLPVVDLSILIGERTGMINWFTGEYGLILTLAGSTLLIGGILIVLPTLLVPLWGARPLPPGELRDALEADCAASGLPHARLRVWGTPGGHIHNAVALGLPPGPRWVLVSADLLNDLPLDQVRAVVGHELGHHRHRHLVSYVWFALAANAGFSTLCRVLLGSCDANGLPLPPPFYQGDATIGTVFALPGAAQLPVDLVIGLTVAPLVLLLWRVLFGVLSRACERQADIAGAELTSAKHMAGALQAVARLSRTPETAPSWRHRPIAERVAFLAGMAGTPGIAQAHHKLVRDMRLLIIASLALLVALAAGMHFSPLRGAATSEHPAADVAEMARADPDLGGGLAAADAGDTRALIAWLTRAEPIDRLKLVILHLREAELSGGTDVGGALLPMDDRSLYRMRWRLSAFSAVPLPEQEYNLMVDNAFAYGLVAGTTHPVPREVDLARSVLPRLEAEVERHPDHAIWDTIGCVRFAAGDWAGAEKAFSEAQRLVASAKLAPGDRQTQSQLYNRRLQAARQNLGLSGPPLPLPLNFVEIPQP